MDEGTEVARRLEQLEESVAYAEHAAGQLDSSILDVARRVEALVARLERVEARVERLAARGDDSGQAGQGEGGPSDDELREMRPPHSEG